MKNNEIEVDVNILLTTKRKFTIDEKNSFLKDLNSELKNFIELKIADLAMKHQKLIDDYDLDINIEY